MQIGMSKNYNIYIYRLPLTVIYTFYLLLVHDTCIN